MTLRVHHPAASVRRIVKILGADSYGQCNIRWFVEVAVARGDRIPGR
jgi:hypothetical protein